MKKRSGFLLVLALVAGAIPAHAQGEYPFELRLPLPMLRALASLDESRDRTLIDDTRRVNPFLVAGSIERNALRFQLTLRLADDDFFVVAGPRRTATQLAEGDLDRVAETVTAPYGYRLLGSAQEGGALVLRYSVSRPSGQIARREEQGLERRGFRWDATGRLLGSIAHVEPSLGGLNPDNRAFEIPSQRAEGEARLDVTADVGRFSFFAKPRARWTWDSWNDGPRDGESETDADLLLLEGAARFRSPIPEGLFLIAGRENLQWGPSQLVSPSNPFFPENGRENPVREIPGMDFFRAVWLPSGTWTVSWITNWGRGEGDLGGVTWHPSHAAKVDYVGQEASGGALVHAGKDHATSLRGYGQWTASDALLVYGEGSVSRGTYALYPVTDTSPAGGHLEATREDDASPIFFVLLGGAYTLLAGPTLSAEYAYNGEGYSQSDADRFFDLGHQVGQLAAAGLVKPDTDRTSTGRRLLRRNYLFLQYLQTEIANKMTLLLRWTQNLDDQSGLATLFADYSLADRWRAFAYGSCGSGGNRDEFGSVVRYSGLIGLEFSAF